MQDVVERKTEKNIHKKVSKDIVSEKRHSKKNVFCNNNYNLK